MLIPCWCIHTHLVRIESDTSGGLRGRASRKEMGQLHNSNQDNKQQTRSLSSSCRTLLKTYLATPCIIENGGQSHSQLWLINGPGTHDLCLNWGCDLHKDDGLA